MAIARIDRWLVHTCTIEKTVEAVVDPAGQPTESRTHFLPSQPCRLMNIAPQSRPREVTDPTKQSSVVADYNLFLRIDQDTENVVERDVVSDIRDDRGHVLIEGPLDIILIVNRYGRDGQFEEYRMLYLKRRGA